MKKLIIVSLLVLSIPQFVGAQTAINPQLLAELRVKIAELTLKIEALKVQIAAQASVTDNQPPVITSIQGSTSLAPGVSGTWRVMATDPEGGALAYSVAWGDLSTPTVQSTNSFSHAYSTVGNYYLTFTVTDRGGKSVRGNTAVLVSTRGVSAVTGSAEISAVDKTTGESLVGTSVTVINVSAQPMGTGVTRVSSGVIFNNLPVGIYTATAIAVGYKPGQAVFTVMRDQTVKPVVKLEKIPVSPLTINVKSNSGSRVGYALVNIYNENGWVAFKATDDSGITTFSNLPTGHTYRVEVTRVGYAKPNAQSTTISGSASASLDFTLNPIH